MRFLRFSVWLLRGVYSADIAADEVVFPAGSAEIV
jgi:hypothetical protein